jgi:hypothetical protein
MATSAAPMTINTIVPGMPQDLDGGWPAFPAPARPGGGCGHHLPTAVGKVR